MDLRLNLNFNKADKKGEVSEYCDCEKREELEVVYSITTGDYAIVCAKCKKPKNPKNATKDNQKD